MLFSPTHMFLGILQEVLPVTLLNFLIVVGTVDQIFNKHLEKTELGPEDPTIFSKNVSWAATDMATPVTHC